MEADKSVKMCSGCPLCNYTRSSKKKSIFYRIARVIQKTCPGCHGANKTLGKNFQKSVNFQE